MNYKREIKLGIFFVLLSALYFLGSLSILTFDPFAKGGLDSRSIPQMLSILVAGLSVIHIVSNVLKLQKAKREAVVSSEAVASSEAVVSGAKAAFKFDRPQRLMLITVLLICAYIFCFNWLGFILSSVLFLLMEIFLLTPAEKRRRWAVFTVGFSIGTPVLLYLLFTKVLSMYLPRGLLG